jgi:hypothetical protein
MHFKNNLIEMYRRETNLARLETPVAVVLESLVPVQVGTEWRYNDNDMQIDGPPGA